MAKIRRQKKADVVAKNVNDEEEVNYAKAADSFAQEEEEEEEDEADDDHQDHDENVTDSEQDNNSDDGNEARDDDDDDDEEEEEEEEEEEDTDGNDVSALFRGSATDDDQVSEDASSDDHGEEDKTSIRNIKASGPEQCNFDLRNLTAMNSHQIPASSLYRRNKKRKDEGEEFITIPLDPDHPLQINEDFLLERATAGCTQLMAAIWQLPTQTSDAGPLATLPGYDEVPIPRSMPPPPPKQETKWEKFAKQKGIPLNKEKRSRKVWDEETGTWMYRHGFEKANSGSKEWPIMEVGANDDPFDDPWEKLRDAKRARTEKNLENRMKNQESAGSLAKGSSNRILKSREKSRELGKKGGNADRDNILPIGVPVDLKTPSGEMKLRGKASTVAALRAVQQSTASLGKFDKMIEGEPERKKILSKIKKRKYESATDKKVITTEGEKSMKILNAVISGGGVAKEKAIRKGKYAKGETAYDYEYNDGLGPSSFRKKKGRAGAGKMKKMTKKRVV